jgi:ABC-2 type transport system permease protein
MIALLWPRVQSAINTATPRFMLTRSPFLLIAILMWVAIFKGTSLTVGFLKDIGPMGDMISMKLLSMIFFGLSGFLLLSNIVTTISACYLSKDLTLFLTRPVPKEKLLIAKSLEAAINANWVSLLFAPAVLIPFATQYNAPINFYFIVLPLLIPFVLITSGIGASIAHILTRLFPVRKIRNAMLALGLMIFVGAYFMLQSSGASGQDSMEGILALMLRIRTDSPMLPGYWMSTTATSLLRGVSVDWLFVGLILSSGIFFTSLAYAIGSKLYARNLFTLSSGASRTTMRPPATYPGHRLAYLWKDARVFMRDTEQWSQLVIIGALLMIYVYNFKVLPIKAFASITPLFEEIAALINIILAGLVLTAVAARFLYVAISAEGAVFWVAITSPIHIRTFLINKFLYGFIPISATVLLLVLLSSMLMSSPLWLTLLSLSAVGILSVSICSMAAAMGAMNPKFNYESLASLSIGIGSVGFMVMAFSLVLLSSALLGWAVYAFKVNGSILQMLIAIAAMLALNTAATLVPMQVGIRKLSRGGLE